MLNRCPNCGGELHYDIDSARLKCIHCGSDFDPETYQGSAEAQEQIEQQDMDMVIYTCPSCGAEISSAEQAAVDYCLYCGSFVTLDSRMSKVKRPDYIIPFSRTQEQCKKSYRNMIRRKLYAPKEFRDDTFLSGFKGIYIPFWTYEYTYGPKIKLPGEESTRHGDYIHKQKYDIICHVDGAVKDVAFDASSSFDDQISRQLVPYPHEKRKKFTPSYMFGFYGDTADVPDRIYADDAIKVARDEIWEELTSNPEVKKGHPERPSDGKLDSCIRINTRSRLTMLPVWFLTWKHKDRVAYSVVNGDTGTIYSEVPVSILRYLMISLLTAIPIFLLLNSLFTFNASNMLFMSCGLAGLMILLYSMELEQIVRRRLHADDRGYLEIYQKGEEPDLQSNLFLEFMKIFFEDIKTALLIILSVILICFNFLFQMYKIAFILFFLILPLYTLWCIYRQGKIIEDNSVVWDVAGAYIAFILSGIIIWMDPAADIFYYFAAILCLIGIGFTAVRTMRRYNDMVTRPLPHFFDRKAGGE